jgi:hypothetical protein
MTPVVDPLSQVLALAVLLASFSFFVLICWRYPDYVFWMVFLLRPLLDMTRLLKGQGLMVRWLINGIGVMVPVALLLVLILHKKLMFKENAIFLLLIGAILLSYFFHEMTAESGEMLIRILTPFAFILFPQVFIKSEEDVKTFLRLVAVSTVFVLIAICLDRSRTNVHPLSGWVQDAIMLKGGGIQNRFAAVFGVPTVTAFWLFQFFAVTYLMFEIEKFPKRWLWIGICLILSVPLFFAFSRAAWLGCWLLIFFYNLLKGRFGRTTVWVLGVVVLAAIIVPDILYRLQNPTAIHDRLLLWSGYIQTLSFKGSLSWLGGLGWANLPEKNLFTGQLVTYGSTGLVENSFLFILAGAGMLALVLFVLAFFQLARWSRWLIRNARTLFIRDFGAWSLAMLPAWFVMSMAGDMVSYVVINWYWYASFGCVLALRKHLKNSLQSSEWTEVSLCGPV